MLRKLYVLVLLITSLSLHQAAVAKDWGELFNHPEYRNVKISPNGKYLAIDMRHNDQAMLAFLDRKTLEPVGNLKFQNKEQPRNYYWVNNERVVIEIAKNIYSQEQPVFYGELYAINIDGSKGEMIYGYQAGQKQTGTKVKKKKSTYGIGEIIDTLPEDDKHILISSTPMSENMGEKLSSVLKINVYSGIIKKSYGKAPISYSRFLTNINGEIKVSAGTDKYNNSAVYIKHDNGWKKLPENTVSNKARPLAIDKTGNSLFFLDTYQEDLTGLFKLNLNDFSYKNIYTDKVVDISDIEMTTDGRSGFAVRIDDGYPAYLILDKNNPEAKAFKTLLQTFPYNEVTITSRTEDGKFYIVAVSSDINPGSLYLFDIQNKKISQLFNFFPNIKPIDLAQMEAIKFKASDGKDIHGYFTPAKGSNEEKIAPLVVLVHGGPHFVRDLWGYSAQVQYLALNGYSVLQVNYRGSGGYGNNFYQSGKKTWGKLIQQDVYDGLQFLITQNKAEKENVCIMGASFGAYSAVQSAAIYPDTYKCGIANAGIYDLELMFEEGDVQNSRYGQNYLKEVLGEDKDLLKSMSPVNYIEKVKIPLLLAHGKEDVRAPFEHVERLRDALDKADRPYEWFVIEKEGHGFYNPENQKAYMRKVVSFLDQHLTK